jgi:hypothetical protein
MEAVMDREVLERLRHLARRQTQLEAKFDYIIDAICRGKMAEPPPPVVLTREEGEKMMLRFSKAEDLPKGKPE